MRAAAGASVVLLTLVWFLPLAGMTTFFVFIAGVVSVDVPVRQPLTEEQVAAVLIIGGVLFLFVAGVFAFRVVLNLLSPQKGSPARWALAAWILSVLPEIWLTRALANVAGSQLGAALWLSTGCALCTAWLAVLLAQVLWRWSSASKQGAASVFAAALVFVVMPGVSVLALGRSMVAELRQRLPPITAPVTVTPVALPVADYRPSVGLSSLNGAPAPAGAMVGASEDPPGSPSEVCLAQLKGEDCRAVWERAVRAFGEGDEVQQAFLYACIDRALQPPRVCATFWSKAEGLRTDSWRYTRKFKDMPESEAPRCPLPTAEEARMSQEELDNLDHAKAQLDERERNILDLAYRDDLTDAKIGMRLGLSAVRVRVLRRGAENKLKTKLESCQ